MAVDQRQRLYSGFKMLTGDYLSSTPMALRFSGVALELSSLAHVSDYEVRALRHYKGTSTFQCGQDVEI
jgi:hypothetical protein